MNERGQLVLELVTDAVVNSARDTIEVHVSWDDFNYVWFHVVDDVQINVIGYVSGELNLEGELDE